MLLLLDSFVLLPWRGVESTRPTLSFTQPLVYFYTLFLFLLSTTPSHQMYSPTYSPRYSHSHRMAPPVRPSRSLEGLERVIPPHSPKQLFSPTRSDLFLNKPLPDAPIEHSAVWSDSSDSESEGESQTTVDSVTSPSEPRNSTESYPIFVSSGSDDFTDLVDHPGPADHLGLGSIRPSPPRFLSDDSRTDSVDSVALSTSRSDAQYGRPSQWSQNRTGTSHYFREKKWDFFPELATPSALQACGKISPGIPPKKSRKKDGRLNLAAKRHRWHSLDRAGLGLACGVRDSIKTYVHRTLSKDSTESKGKESPRPATAPVAHHDEQDSFPQREDVKTGPHSSLDINVPFRALSVATDSGTSEIPQSPRSIRTHRSVPTQRQKQLAVPMSPYQKYGSAIWEPPQKSKRIVRSGRQRQLARADSSSPGFSDANPTPPLSPPLKMQLQQNTREAVRVLQGRTSHVLVVLDGAKKKMIESKDERRREALKSRITLVGPVDPHACLQEDAWF